jgi:hypothetical protein
MAAPLGALVYGGALLGAEGLVNITLPYRVAVWAVCGFMACGPGLAWRGLTRVSNPPPPIHLPGRIHFRQPGWNPARLRRAAGAYAASFALGVVFIAHDPFGDHSAHASLVVLTGAGLIWCVRNMWALPRLQELARCTNSPLTGGLARWMRWGPVLNAPALILLALLSGTNGNDPVFTAAALVAGGTIVAWLGAWVILLANLYLRVRRIDRELSRRPPIEVV